ncbi:MAG: class I adenylate-forming enzyme family protein [Dehalococcoidia bacterium]
MNLKQTLEQTACDMPRKEAIVSGNRRITYGDLNEASNRVANALTELGMSRGDHVAILMSHSPEWVISYFGVVKGGGVAVLLNPALKSPELSALLRDSESTILMTEQQFSRMFSPVSSGAPFTGHVIEVDAGGLATMMAHTSAESPAVDIEDGDDAAIIYTSGVVGSQKGVVHTHASLLGTPPIVSAAIQRKSEDVMIDLVRFSHLFGLCEVLLGSILTGSTIVLIPDFTPRVVLEALDREKGSIIFGVPAMYNAMAMVRGEVLRGYDLNSLRLAVTAGAKSFPELMKALEEKLALSLYEVYGLTEVSAVSISTQDWRKLGTVGKPICDIRIVGDDGQNVRQGEIGEAVFKAPWVMKGYHKAPDLTAEVCRDGWFSTGDLVRMDEEGYLEYIEKKSFIIVTPSGLKIGPSEVEFVLLGHPGVAEAAYVGIDDGYGDQIPTAFVVLKEGQHVTVKELSDLCYENLADFKLPKRIEFIDGIPKTASGKIDRRCLKEMQIGRGGPRTASL